MGRIERAACAAMAMVAVAALTGCQPRSPWSSELASVDATGTDSARGPTHGGTLSPDGTKIVLSTAADDLGPTDTNGWTDVYLRDLVTGTTTLVSHNLARTDSGNGASGSIGFTPDGTKLAFNSLADNLVPDDDDVDYDVFLYDLASGEIANISVEEPGGEPFGSVYSVEFDAGGDRIVFFGGDTEGVHLRDLATGEVTLVSLGAEGATANGTSGDARFSPDGTQVVFSSEATNLGPKDSNGSMDVYLHDLTSRRTTLVSAAADTNVAASWDSHTGFFSPDGSKVAFLSFAGNLGPNDTNGDVDVYLRDLATGTTTLVSTNADGTDAGNLGSGVYGLALSPDGTGIVFTSRGSDLGPTDTNGEEDVYFHDFTTGLTTLVSANAGGTDSGAARSREADGMPFSPDGRRIVFVSVADDLGPRDTNGREDVYVRDLDTGATTLVSANADGTDSGNGYSGEASEAMFSTDGRRVVFHSRADDLGGTDTNGVADVYIATFRAADLGVTVTAEPGTVVTGETVTYEVKVTNGGPDPAVGAAAALLLPHDAVMFTDVTTTTGTCAPPPPDHPGLVTCDLGDAPVGDVATITVTAEVTLPPGGLFAARARVSSTTVDDDGSNDGDVAESAVA